MTTPLTIVHEEHCNTFASLLDEYPWTRKYFDYHGNRMENITGWFDADVAMHDFPGWADIIAGVCSQIQDVLDRYDIPSEQFVIDQVKEKMASLRIY